MFGYVSANPKGLSPEEFAVYRSYYCGLCRCLHSRHGQSARLALTYDMTFLVILLTALYESDCENGTLRCLPHPVKPHPWKSSEFTDYAADMSIALTYYNLMDNWEDSRSAPSLALAKALKRRFLKVSCQYPRQCSAIHTCLARLAECEKAGLQDLDAVSGCFGRLMAELLDYRRDVWSLDLQQMGFSLGKFIYLMDAYEDLPKDQKAGRYNPLAGVCGREDYETYIFDILELQMAQCAAAFERLPILQDASILRNILYSGVWMRYYSLQDKDKKGEDSD